MNILEVQFNYQQTMRNNQSHPNEILQEIFNPKNFMIESSIQKLNDYGGILSLINQLKTCHRKGLSTNNKQDHQTRKREYGYNKEPMGLSILKKSLLQQRDFIVNLLFYLLTLRICVKFLLFRDQIRGLHPIGDQPFHLRINAQLMSFFFLIALIALKAKVSVQYYTMDRDQRKYRNERIVVKRDGQRQVIYEKDLMVGDILIVEKWAMVRVDGIVLLSKNLVVSQAHTILKQDSKNKTEIWVYDDPYQRYDKNKDPFILAGSLVTEGYGQILVCTVGQKCTFRVDKQNKGYYSQYTPSISQTKRVMNYIQNICKGVTIVLATLISFQYLSSRYRDDNEKVTWMDLLQILKIYCGFIGMVCFVQRLKIIKSLQFYIEQNRSQKQYRVRNKASYEYLSKLDILFIEMSTLAMRKVYFRDETGFELDHITQISNINNLCQIKIICQENREEIYKIFGSDIEYQSIFQPNQHAIHSNHVKSLVQATFITQTSISKFIKQYLPIYKALKYEIGYLYDSSIQPHREINSQFFQINFQKLIVNPIQQTSYHILNQEANESSYLNQFASPTFWIKIQKKLFMQDVLYTIFLKAHAYSNLYNVYITIYANNVLVFIITCWFSTFVSVINLTWHLVLIIAHRFMFVTIYKRMSELKQLQMRKQVPWLDTVKFNLVMFPYYFFIANRFKQISDLYIFFLINGVLRAEVLLHKKKPISVKSVWLKWVGYLSIFVFIKICAIAWYWKEEDQLAEELNNTKYTIGLFFIYASYIVFL